VRDSSSARCMNRFALYLRRSHSGGWLTRRTRKSQRETSSPRGLQIVPSRIFDFPSPPRFRCPLRDDLIAIYDPSDRGGRTRPIRVREATGTRPLGRAMVPEL
jgi:hypothetical protein